MKILNIKKIIHFFREHKIHILLILLMALFIYLRFWDFFSFDNIREGDCLVGRMDALNFVKRSVLDYHQFPLWMPNVQGGSPFFAHHIYQTVSYGPLISMIIPSPQGMYNLTQMLGIFLSGLFMYILMIHLKLKPRFAFISSLFYMFSPYAITLISAYNEQLQVYVWTPLIFLFLWKAVTTKEWIKNSMIVGLIIAITFMGGGYDASLFLVLVFIAVFSVYIFGKNIPNRIIKVALISITILIFLFGLFSIKLFLLLEYNELSSKKQIEVYSYEKSIKGHNIKRDINSFSDFFQVFFFPIKQELRQDSDTYYIKLGISGLILFLFAFYKWRKRAATTFFVLTLLTLLIALPTPVWYLFWKFIPFFDAIHHLARSLYLYCFATSALIGIGSYVLFTKLSKTLSKKQLNIAFLFIILIILVDLFFVTGYMKGGRINEEPGTRFKDCFENNYLLHNLSQEPGIFRINNLNTKSHAGQAPAQISILDLQMLYGGSGTWFPEFYTYLGIAHSFPAKFYGMLNTKYLYSNALVNMSDLRFINKFDEYEICTTHEDGNTDVGINGPYLYQNELYLPRAYVVDNAILVIGEKNSVDQTSYSLMMDPGFDPSNNVIVMDYGKINDHQLDFLKRFNAIFLTPNSVDQNSGLILTQYADSGGLLLPDILNGENTVSQQDVDNMFAPLEGDYNSVNEAEISYYSPKKIVIDLKGETGWLVLAEKFFMFQGWEPTLNKKEKPIYRANGMNSAVYLESESGSLVFNYWPDTFKKGLLISSITLLVIIFYFAFRYLKKTL